MKKIKKALSKVTELNRKIQDCRSRDEAQMLAAEQERWLRKYIMYVRNDHDQFATLYDEVLPDEPVVFPEMMM